MRRTSVPVLAVLSAVAILLASNGGSAEELTVKDYDAAKAKLPEFKLYFTGVGRGAFWLNANLPTHGGKPLFCPPEKLGLNGENYTDVLEEAVKRYRKSVSPEMSLDALLIQGLMDTFPCTQVPK